MSDWTPSVESPGYIEKRITRGDATIIIRRPVLNEEERARREGKTREALENALRGYVSRRKACWN